MGDDITIGVTEIVNNIEVTAQPNDQIVDISVTDNADNVTLNITPTVIEINVNKGSSFAKWGDIYGTLSDQTDLQNALNLKANLVGGKVPASELPSYVDDIIEVANYAALPATGETGKIYVTLDNNKIYRWSGSIYIEIASNSAIWGAITGTLSSQTDLVNALNLRVPYTGATSNVNLGEYGLTSGFLGLDTTPTSTPTGIGTIYWDAANRTAALIDGDGDTTLQIGQEQRILVHNNTGSTLTDGQVVYVTGSTGNVPSVSLANASSETTSAATIGVVTESIAQGADGFITTSGIVNGLNTLAFNEGDLLWLGTTAGTFTATKPISPNHLVLIGYVIKKAGGNGSILVKIQNTQELEESSDVLFTSLANNQVLTYESATDLWKNKSIATVLGYTPANDASVVKVTTDQNIRGIKTFLGDQTATTLKLIVADYYNDGIITSDNGMLRLLNGTTELFNLASTGDLTAKSFVKTGGTASQFLKANGTVDSTTYLSGTVAIANGGTGATTASAARTNLGATTIGSGLFTLPNAGLVSFLRVNADNTVELLGADLFRTSIGAGTGNGSVTSVSGTGSYGGLTLTGTVTGSGDLTLGGTPTGTWPISVSGNAASVNTVQVSTNADFYLTFADANNGSPTSEFLYTIGSVKVNPSTGALTAGSFVKSGGTSSQYLMADGSVSTGSGGTVTGTGTTNYIPKFTGASAIGNSLIYDNGTNVGIGTTSPLFKLSVVKNASGIQDTLSLENNIQSVGVIDGVRLKLRDFNIESSSTYGSADNIFTIGIGSSKQITLLQNGNVGIGTTSPNINNYTRALTVLASSGYAGIEVYGGSTTAGAQIDFGGGTDRFASISGEYESATNGFLNIRTKRAGAMENAMRITSGGHLLVGTTTSLYGNSTRGNIELNGSASSLLALKINDAIGCYLYTSNVNSELYSTLPLTFAVNGSERMRITSGGNIGIGTTSPAAKLHISGNANSAFLYSDGAGSGYSFADIRNTGARLAFGVENSTGSTSFTGALAYSSWIGSLQSSTAFQIVAGNSLSTTFLANGNVGIGTTSPGAKLDVNGDIYTNTRILADTFGGYSGGDLSITTNTSGSANLLFKTASNERMRIASNGDFYIGKTSRDYTTVGTQIEVSGKALGVTRDIAGENIFLNKTSSQTGSFISFYYNNGAVGSIQTNGSSTGYYTTSDYRLKQDLKSFNGLDLISNIKVYDYEWKANNSRSYGVMAHELQEVIPDAVTGDKDGEKMQSVDYSKLVPILVASIQELKAEIELLKSKL